MEDLLAGRVRGLTRQTRTGRPAAALARQRPDPVLNGHRARLDGLVRTAAGRTGECPPAARGAARQWLRPGLHLSPKLP
ncbi:hypothetical protein [Streptomyces cinereospinus]|uniref:Uncharacterized protein n=1 Tax=Streptomyces cinereospinus TaxID=285561 RepID=A0ABV5N170_9ACTN